jgi:hypothetical protein
MATQQINASQLALTPQQIQSLSASDQSAYLNSLPPNQQAIYQQELANLGNADFMRNSLINDVFCPVTGGNGPTQNYVAGSTLYFDLPTTAGFAHELEIIFSLTVTLAAGTNATYALTPAGKFAIFNRLELDYNGPQIVTHPYFLAVLDQLQGRQRRAQNQPLTGAYIDSDIDSNLVGTSPVAVGANTWKGRIRLRLNPLGPESPYGLLPLSGVGNRPQLKLTAPSTLFGTDPLNNAICSGGSGTGQAVTTVTGTVQVNCLFRDGKNLGGITPKMLSNWQAMPTMQMYWESSLTPFNAAQLNRFTIATKFEHWYVVAIIIDGQQSTSFISGNSNLTSFGLSPDFTAQQYFEAWNIANNISIYDYFQLRVRQMIGEDMLQQGIIPWVVAPLRNISDADNRNGAQYLNMYAEGFPAATHVYQVGATGSVTTARVELFLCSKNRSGLKIS